MEYLLFGLMMRLTRMNVINCMMRQGTWNEKESCFRWQVGGQKMGVVWAGVSGLLEQQVLQPP